MPTAFMREGSASGQANAGVAKWATNGIEAPTTIGLDNDNVIGFQPPAGSRTPK